MQLKLFRAFFKFDLWLTNSDDNSILFYANLARKRYQEYNVSNISMLVLCFVNYIVA